MVTSVQYNGDGTLLATAGHDSKVLLWETEMLTGQALTLTLTLTITLTPNPNPSW